MKSHTAWQHPKSRDYRMSQTRLDLLAIFSLVLTMVMGALITGCTVVSSNYRSSFGVSRQFEDGEVVPGYRYHVSGPVSKPLAIVAIRQDFRLESEHWRGIDLDTTSLKALVKRISHVLYAEYKADQMIPNGATIIDTHGAMVGMWYSVYNYSKVTFPDDKVIHIGIVLARMPPGVRIPLD